MSLSEVCIMARIIEYFQLRAEIIFGILNVLFQSMHLNQFFSNSGTKPKLHRIYTTDSYIKFIFLSGLLPYLSKLSKCVKQCGYVCR